MTESEALARMIAPGTIRPGKMGCGGVCQVHVARACSRSCFNCTQGSQLSGKPHFISPENFEACVVSLKGYFGLVAMFGGQPTLHPKFAELCQILAKHVPLEKRGLWTNALNGHGAICRATFQPRNCNLNVHLSQSDYDEFRRDWPEAMPFGLHEDSRHSPPYVAMMDVIPDEAERWRLIADCDINRHWSPLAGEFRGRPRAWFCELAAAQSILHEDDPDWPDTGLDPTLSYDRYGNPIVNSAGEPIHGVHGANKWWQLPMQAFASQVRWHCHRCGVPLRGHGALAQADNPIQSQFGPEPTEQVSATHEAVYKPKRKGRRVELVTVREQLGKPLENVVKYVQNARL